MKEKEVETSVVSETKTFKIEFSTEMLGTAPKDKEVYASYVASKAPVKENGDEEVESIFNEDKGVTGFLTDENGLYLPSYMIKGFFKHALQVMMDNGAVEKITAYKTLIDNVVFINPRKLYFGKKEPDGTLERPLRVITPQGFRVCLSKSEYVNIGTQLEFEVELLKNKKGLTMDVIEKLLEYGRYCGLGQWRGSGGYGQFKVIK